MRTNAARNLIRRWGTAGIVSPQMLRDIEAAWLEVLGTDDDNVTSPSRDNLHPKAKANAGEVGALVNRLTEPPVSGFFATCSVCDGDGCGWCYGRGLAPPKGNEHNLDCIEDTIGAADELALTLERPDFSHRRLRALEWQYVTGRTAEKLLSRWAQEDRADHGEYWPFDPARPYCAQEPLPT